MTLHADEVVPVAPACYLWPPRLADDVAGDPRKVVEGRREVAEVLWWYGSHWDGEESVTVRVLQSTR